LWSDYPYLPIAASDGEGGATFVSALIYAVIGGYCAYKCFSQAALSPVHRGYEKLPAEEGVQMQVFGEVQEEI
jgi:hypothetical protein